MHCTWEIFEYERKKKDESDFVHLEEMEDLKKRNNKIIEKEVDKGGNWGR